jgi:hypothetical protein
MKLYIKSCLNISFQKTRLGHNEHILYNENEKDKTIEFDWFCAVVYVTQYFELKTNSKYIFNFKAANPHIIYNNLISTSQIVF